MKKITAFVLCVSVLCLPLAQAQVADEIANLKAEVARLRAERDAEISALEKRIEEFEKKFATHLDKQDDNLAMTHNEVESLNKTEEKKEKGDIKTYADMTALQAYQTTLPQELQKGDATMPARLFEYLTKGFEWQGYFRSGYGINSEGGHMEAFQAPGALAKYRLGNEAETYIETALIQKNWNPDDTGPKIKSQIRLSYQTQEYSNWDKDNMIVLREAYASMDHFIDSDPEATVWAGERFYRLPELNINDFWWYDLSGYGGGFENISVPFGKFALAYIGFSPNASSYWTSTDKEAFDFVTTNGRLAKNNLNLMLSEVAVPGGRGTFWINGGFLKGGTTTGDQGSRYEYPSQTGFDIGAMHQVKLDSLENQFAVQYGLGPNSSLSAGANLPPTSDNEDAWALRFTEMYDQQITDVLSAEINGVYQLGDSGLDHNSRFQWASLGLRPVYHFTDHFGFEFEPGVDYVENSGDGPSSYLAKTTFAFRLSPHPDFFSRPAFRLFATYAGWGEGFRGYSSLGGDGYLNSRDGWNFGVQAEHWW